MAVTATLVVAFIIFKSMSSAESSVAVPANVAFAAEAHLKQRLLSMFKMERPPIAWAEAPKAPKFMYDVFEKFRNRSKPSEVPEEIRCYFNKGKPLDYKRTWQDSDKAISARREVIKPSCWRRLKNAKGLMNFIVPSKRPQSQQ